MNRTASWAAAISAAVLIVAPRWIWASPVETAVGTLRPLAVERPSRADLGRADRPVARLAIRSGLLEDQPDRIRRAVPTRVEIRAIDVDAPIVPVGVAKGTTQIPPDADRVGWYRFGGRLGDEGSTLLVAHVSAGAQGPGAFSRLREARPGALVVVHTRAGPRLMFRVIALRWYHKGSLPGAVFRRTGPEVLTLVTCGGPYSEVTGRYRDNLVVYAVPRP